MRFLKAIGKGGALVDMNEAVADIDMGARGRERWWWWREVNFTFQCMSLLMLTMPFNLGNCKCKEHRI